MNFSQRIGIKPIKKPIQINSIDEELRNTLWSVLTAAYWEIYKAPSRASYDPIKGSNLERLFKSLWILYFKKPIDAIPTYYGDDNGGLDILRKYYFAAEWYEVYDFVEFISIHGPEDRRDVFISDCNTFLDIENSGYRFVDSKIIEITSAEEINEIETAIENSTPYYGVKQHLKEAITLMGDRKFPDYRNSIKESISAVEALCKKVADDDDATLGEAIKILEKKGSVHPALKKAFSSLYGYTSNADGIRHALLEEINLTSADARFMLISCSAFINYVIARINLQE